MKHKASKCFWRCLEALPADVQAFARRNFVQLKTNPSHPPLHFKKAVGRGRFHSVRIGLYYRALGLAVPDGFIGSGGTYGEYDKIVG